MRTFIKNCILVSLPTIGFLVAVLAIAINHNLHRYSSLSSHKDFLLGEPYNDEYVVHYKLNHDLQNFSVLALGSSRVLQFSNEMFDEPFFNLGYTSRTIVQIQKILEKLRVENKTLIVGLDQWSFNGKCRRVHDARFKPSEVSFRQAAFSQTKLRDILRGKITWNRKPSDEWLLIGSGANLALNGMKSDGSFYYGQIIHGRLHHVKELIGLDFEFEYTLERIQQGNFNFEPEERASQISLEHLENLIQACKKGNNRPVLFFPPFAPFIAKRLANENYGYIRDASFQVAKICEKHEVAFFDFTHFPSMDSDYVDGFHAGKKVYYEMLQKLGIPFRHLEFENPFESDFDKPLSDYRENFFKSVSHR